LLGAAIIREGSYEKVDAPDVALPDHCFRKTLDY